MKTVVQRVKQASVHVENIAIGQIEQGLLVLFGLHHADTAEKLPWMVEKLINLRLFSDENGKMNLSVQDIRGSLLVVSQFTLYANCHAGRRPSFTHAMKPEMAEPLYETFVTLLREKLGKSRIQTGQFGAHMEIELINDGPVTLIIEL